ncbi:MAG: hypothetical protein ACKOBD_07435 [Chloroflexota bacterium]
MKSTPLLGTASKIPAVMFTKDRITKKNDKIPINSRFSLEVSISIPKESATKSKAEGRKSNVYLIVMKKKFRIISADARVAPVNNRSNLYWQAGRIGFLLVSVNNLNRGNSNKVIKGEI